MSLQQLIQFGSLGLGAVATVSFAVLAGLYAYNERRRRAQLENTEADKAEITILFQTMRDVVGQQKSLARQFNQDLDAKMNVVKHILAQSLEKNKKLYDEQRALAAELEAAKAQVFTMQKQMAYMREETERLKGERPEAGKAHVPGTPVRGGDAHDTSGGPGLGVVLPHGRADAPPEAAKPAGPSDAPEPAPAIIGKPQRGERRPSPGELRVPEGEALTGTGLTRAHFEKWVGDALDQARGRGAAEEPPPAPAVPEDPEAARKAFRTLLDKDRAVQDAPRAGGNGAHALAPLQRRVVEYHDAGMTVQQIAQELGIGKGEVRLMLSLARQDEK